MVDQVFVLNTLLYVTTLLIGGRVLYTSINAYFKTRSTHILSTVVGFAFFIIGVLWIYLSYHIDSTIVTGKTVPGLAFFFGFAAFWLSFKE